MYVYVCECAHAKVLIQFCIFNCVPKPQSVLMRFDQIECDKWLYLPTHTTIYHSFFNINFFLINIRSPRDTSRHTHTLDDSNILSFPPMFPLWWWWFGPTGTFWSIGEMNGVPVLARSFGRLITWSVQFRIFLSVFLSFSFDCIHTLML